MTLGERRVRAAFNPSGTTVVDEIKNQAARLINLLDTIDPSDFEEPGEVARLKALAMTDAESASGWGVKAVTARRAG